MQTAVGPVDTEIQHRGDDVQKTFVSATFTDAQLLSIIITSKGGNCDTLQPKGAQRCTSYSPL